MSHRSVRVRHNKQHPTTSSQTVRGSPSIPELADDRRLASSGVKLNVMYLGNYCHTWNSHRDSIVEGLPEERQRRIEYSYVQR